MKKPLILLVDDDREVLVALEAELSQAFGEIARIEAFDRPREVLAALSQWRTEERSIAIAVVDQKMPGLSGVDLLVALRESVTGPEFQPARHVRAVLLTGYAGLDSALAAKNEAGVERYLEKPWDAEHLRAVAWRMLSSYSVASEARSYFAYREITDIEEAEAALRLRFSVYSRTAGISELLPREGDAPLDVDEFDRDARLFGLFHHGVGPPEMVGTIRVVGEAREVLAPALEALFSEETRLGARLRKPRRVPLPLMKYLPDREAVGTLVLRLFAAGEAVVEPGRFALSPNFRSGGERGDRHLARLMIEGSVAYLFFHLGRMNALLACVPAHAAFYAPYGFVTAENTRARFEEGLQLEMACLHGRIDQVPPAAQVHCVELAARVALDASRGGGAVCRCAAFPECMGGPYGSGDFSTIDVWCPALASRRLGTEVGS